MNQLTLKGKGLLVGNGQFSPAETAALRVWSIVPGSALERLFFSGRRTDMFFQKSLQSCLRGPRTVHFTFETGGLKGFRFECATSHKYFLLGNSFERHMQEKLASLVTGSDVVYDVGAHFGWWTLWFSRNCQAVVAFEPSPTNFPILARNISSNSRSNVKLHHFAASESKGSLTFVESGSYSHVSTGGGLGGLTVKTERLDDCVDDPSPTFVKIDVEGHAASVLKGMQGLLNERRPRVVCEVHHAEEELAVESILRSHEYNVRYLEGDESRFPKYILAVPPAGLQ